MKNIKAFREKLLNKNKSKINIEIFFKIRVGIIQKRCGIKSGKKERKRIYLKEKSEPHQDKSEEERINLRGKKLKSEMHKK